MTLLASVVGMSVSVCVFVHDVNPSQIIMLYAILLYVIIRGRHKFAYAAMSMYSMTLPLVIVCIETAVNV